MMDTFPLLVFYWEKTIILFKMVLIKRNEIISSNMSFVGIKV